MGASYAVFTDTFKSDKKQVVEVGTTKIELIEPSTGLSLGSVEEMSDSNGLLQENYYSFSVKNTGDSDTKYNLYLLDDADTISTYEGILLADKYLRVGLTKNEEELGPLNLDTQKRLIDTGIINAGATNNYKLRLWLNFEGLSDSEKDVLDGQSKFLKLKLTGEQNFSNTLTDFIIKRDLKTNKSESNGLFSTNDTNSGKPSYYYKGAVDNNYVIFANMLWRIVRVNEDGSIRLILNDGIDDNSMDFYFNKNHVDDIKYTYYSESNVDGGIMKDINNWYNTNLKDYDNYIVLGDFCEQAKVKFDSNITTGNATVQLKENYKPSLKCVVDGNGKGPLTLKAGLITVDELLYAGIEFYPTGASSTAESNYLYHTYTYWTMSPCGRASDYFSIWNFASHGKERPTNNMLGRIYAGYAVNGAVWGEGTMIRPVINLKQTSNFKGNGSIDNPFNI